MKIKNWFVSSFLSLCILFGSICVPLTANASDALSLTDYTVQQIQFYAEKQDDLVSDTFFIDYSDYLGQYNTTQQFATAVSQALNVAFDQHPEFYFCRFSQLSVDGLAEMKYSALYTDKDQLFADYKSLTETANAIVAGMDASWSDYEKALYLHDYLVSASSVSSLSNSANLRFADLLVSPILYQTGTSRAYTDAYRYLLMLSGVDCDRVLDINTLHSINAVYLDSNWYYVDVFHDDLDEYGRISHDYFLLNYSEITQVYEELNRDYTGYDTSEVYSDDVIKTAESAVHHEDVSYVFVDELGRLIQYNTESNTSVELAVVEEKWSIYSSSTDQTYAKNYTSLAKLFDYYIYSTPSKLYVIDVNGDAASHLVYELEDTTDGEIYGITANGSQINMKVKKSYSNDEVTKDVIFAPQLKVENDDIVVPVDAIIQPSTFRVTFLTYTLDDADFTVTADTSIAGEFQGKITYNGLETPFTFTTYLKYDVNCDGEINSADLLQLKLYILNLTDLSTDGIRAADVNQDGYIDSFDLYSLRMEVVSKQVIM